MNRIITEKASTLKALAKQALSSHWGEAVLFTLVCQLILQAPSVIYGFLPEAMQTGILATVINIYSFVIHGPVTVSLSYYFIKVFRQEEHKKGLGELKYGFQFTSKAIILYLRIAILTWIGTIFFVIPGILAALNYSQAFFIMADDPTKTPQQCMIESKFIMNGNKIKYICLLLSFLGWLLLASIPGGICHIVFDKATLDLMIKFIEQGDLITAASYAGYTGPITSALLLLQVFVTAYINAAKVSFFDILCGKLVIRRADEMSDLENSIIEPVNVEVTEEKEEETKPVENTDYEYKEIDNDDLH